MDRTVTDPHDPSDEGDERVGALLRSTGRRPAVPEDLRDRVRAAVSTHWRTETRRRARRRRLWIAATLVTAAAAVLGLVVLGWPRPEPSRADAVAGRVEARVGAAWARPAHALSDAAPALPDPGTDVRVGAELATEQGGRLALRMRSGHSVRLDERTRVRLLADAAIALERGAVYVDSRGPHGLAQGSVEIRTAQGSVREIGTQFETRFVGGALVVRVREGLVSFRGDGVPLDVHAGEEIVLASGAPPLRRALATSADEWGWIGEITPLMDVEGRTLREFLDWITHERGLRLEFATTDLAAAAARTRLNGSIDGMTLDQALQSVLATCSMGSRATADTLVVIADDGSRGPS